METKSTQIAVGALGPAFMHSSNPPLFEGDQFLDQPAELPWEDRKKVVISADLTTPLGEVIDQAAEQLGVGIREGPMSRRVPCIALHDGKQYGFMRTTDRDGEPGWQLRWSEVQVGELIASAEAGLVEGDPRRLLLWPVIPQAVFTEIGGALLWMWMMWEHYLAARETTGIISSIIARLRRGRAAAGGANPAQWSLAWHEALRRANDLMAFLDEPRTTEEISAYTGVTQEQAEGTLLALGFTTGDDGTWRPGGDAAAEILHAGLLDLKRDGLESPAPDDAGPRSEPRIREAEDSTRSDCAP
jgi:hypothetical protein